MAVFNPQIPDTNDPNWLGWSKPVAQPAGDKSTATALASIGEIGGEAIKFADTAIKSVLEDQVYTSAKDIQSRYTADLKNADDQIRLAQAGTKTPAPAGSPLNILTADVPGGPQMPVDIKNLPVTIDGLGNARANGKLSETDYAGRVDTMLKDYRSRYPGYKEFIDNVGEKATGINAANKQIQSILGDINSYVTNVNAVRNRTIAYLSNHDVLGMPEGPATLQRYMRGEINEEQAYMAVAPGLQQERQFKINKMSVEDYKGNNEVREDMAAKVVSGRAADLVSRNIDSIVLQGAGGPEKLADFLEKYKPGSGNTIPDDQWITLGQVLKFNRAKVANQIRDELNVPGKVTDNNPRGLSVAQIGGDAKTNAVVAEKLKWYDDMIDRVDNKNLGGMFLTANMIKAQAEGTAAKIMKEFPLMAVVKAAETIGGPQFVPMFWQGALEAGLSPPERNAMVALASKLGAQPNLQLGNTQQYNDMFFRPTPTGKIYTLSQALEDVKPDPHDPAPTVVASKNLNKAITELPSRVLLNPDLAEGLKVNFAKAAFDPSNEGYIGKIRGTESKHSVFMDMSSPKITQEVWKLGQKDPNVWKMYKDWVGNEGLNQLINPELRSLNNIQSNPDIKITWDNENHQFGLTVGKDVNVNLSRRPPLNPGSDIAEYYSPDRQMAQTVASASINKINNVLRSVANVYQQEGKDPNVYVIQSLMRMGFEPNTDTIPSKMINAVSATGNLLGKEKDQRIPYDVEQAPSSGALGSSLSDFLSNPAGVVPYKVQNAPASLKTRSKGTSSNMSDNPFLSIKTNDIPEGMSAREFLQLLQKQGK